MDVFDDEMIVGVFEIRAIHLELFWTDVVRVSDSPTFAFQADSHQADSSEELSEGAVGRFGETNHFTLLITKRRVRISFFSNR